MPARVGERARGATPAPARLWFTSSSIRASQVVAARAGGAASTVPTAPRARARRAAGTCVRRARPRHRFVRFFIGRHHISLTNEHKRNLLAPLLPRPIQLRNQVRLFQTSAGEREPVDGGTEVSQPAAPRNGEG